MNINFHKITLKNFLSFKNAELRLDIPGYITVKGYNNNQSDLSSSNGSGKSALFDSIFWVLTGETIRGGKDVVNRFSKGGTAVTIEFNKDDDEYIILRTKDDEVYKSTLKIYKNNKDISGKGLRDSEKILQEELPDLTSTLLTSVIIFGQGLPQRFSNNTPSGRKEILEQLAKADFMIEDLKDRMSNRKATINKKLEEYKNKSIELQTKSSMLYQMITKNEEQLNVYDQMDLNSLQNDIEQLKQNQKDYETMIIVYQGKYDSTYNQFQTINRSRDKLQFEYDTALDELRTQYDQKLSPLHITIIGLEAEIRTLKAEKKKLDSISDICPTCKQKLPDVHKIDTSYIENEIDQKTYSLNVNQELVDKYTLEKQDKENSLRDNYRPEYDSLTNKIIEYEDLSFQYADKIDSIKKDQKEIEKQISQIQAKIDSYESIKQNLINQIQEYRNELEDINKNLLYINNNKEQYETHYEILQQINTILTRDFRSYLLQNVIQYIDMRCKYYCNIVFNTSLIEFIIDGNKISISYDGKEYELLSGGEKQKLDIIIQLSIRDMLCKYLNFSCNILILDEILDNLDDVGSNKIIDLLSSELNDVSSVFVISHRSDFTIPCDNEINIIKGADKISTIL